MRALMLHEKNRMSIEEVRARRHPRPRTGADQDAHRRHLRLGRALLDRRQDRPLRGQSPDDPSNTSAPAGTHFVQLRIAEWHRTPVASMPMSPPNRESDLFLGSKSTSAPTDRAGRFACRREVRTCLYLYA